MRNEPKTPLQLRAESMVKDEELLAGTISASNINNQSFPPEYDEEIDPRDSERKEVIFIGIE